MEYRHAAAEQRTTRRRRRSLSRTAWKWPGIRKTVRQGGGYGGGYGGRAVRDSDSGQRFPERHPERYGGAANNDIHPSMREIMAPIVKGDHIPISEAIRAANTTFKQLAALETHEEGICPAFTAGFCRNKRCSVAYLVGQETPKQYVEKFCRVIGPGAERLKKEGVDQFKWKPNKRRY